MEIRVEIPFSGFYCSFHDDNIDRALDSMFSDRATGCEINSELRDRFSDATEYGLVFANYAAAYVKAFAAEFQINGLKFERLQSPREYNFETDRIFATTTRCELARIYRATDKTSLAELARERFTSRDGFISFYDPDVKNWGAFNTWDCNQYGLLLAAYAQQENYTGDFDQYAEHSLTEDFSGNGWLYNWLFDACPISNRLFRVFDYLESRKERGAQ